MCRHRVNRNTKCFVRNWMDCQCQTAMFIAIHERQVIMISHTISMKQISPCKPNRTKTYMCHLCVLLHFPQLSMHLHPVPVNVVTVFCARLLTLPFRLPTPTHTSFHREPLIFISTISFELGDVLSTPRRELAPPIEEDEEQDSESQRGAPLRQIENNISALLRGDIPIVGRVDIAPPHRRPVGFRAGVHKSESAKEMLLSQNVFGPLPPSPPSSSPDETDGFPPLPPSPLESSGDKFDDVILTDAHTFRTPSLTKSNRYRDSSDHVPAIPPHRCTPTLNTLKTRCVSFAICCCFYGCCYPTNVSMSPNSPMYIVSGQWMLASPNATRTIMFQCHRMHLAHYRKSSPVHVIPDDALCPAHFQSDRHRVRAKNDVCKRLVVYRKRQYSPEGKHLIHLIIRT